MIPATENGPALWETIINPIAAAYGCPAIIAGGAVRDHLLGVDAKDIDVFVDVASIHDLEAEIAALAEAGFDLEPMDHTEYEDAPDWVDAVRGVLDGNFRGYPLQIIARPSACFTGSRLVEKFDLAITQCWFDGEVHDTAAAAKDRAERTATVTRWNSPAHVAVTYARFERFNQRQQSPFRLVDNRPEFLSAGSEVTF